MFKEVVNFLALHCADIEDRHTLIDPVFDEHPNIHNRINFSGDAQTFASRLVRLLRRHGEITPGVQALWHLLLTLREQVGFDQQQKIDSFKVWANKLQTDPDPPHPTIPMLPLIIAVGVITLVGLVALGSQLIAQMTPIITPTAGLVMQLTEPALSTSEAAPSLTPTLVSTPTSTPNETLLPPTLVLPTSQTQTTISQIPTISSSTSSSSGTGSGYLVSGGEALLQLTSVDETMTQLTTIANVVQNNPISNNAPLAPTSTLAPPTQNASDTAVAIEQEITTLIHTEAWAVVYEHTETIDRIFAPDVTIIDRTNNETYHDPADLYDPKFKTYKFCSVSHYGIKISKITENTASATSGSYGDYGFNWQRTCSIHFDNPPGSDIWQFERIDGEWKIVSFSFK
jgi:hypothetical protein